LVHVIAATLLSFHLNAVRNSTEVVGKKLQKEVGTVGIDRIQLFFLFSKLLGLQGYMLRWK
jgi:hypothetical protein